VEEGGGRREEEGKREGGRQRRRTKTICPIGPLLLWRGKHEEGGEGREEKEGGEGRGKGGE
jgi:hypothetical protein